MQNTAVYAPITFEEIVMVTAIITLIQIGLPLRSLPILLITHMITDQIGLHSVLLPLLIFCFNLMIHIKGRKLVKQIQKSNQSIL